MYCSRKISSSLLNALSETDLAICMGCAILFFWFGLARWRPGSGQNGATTAAAALVRRALSRLSLDPDRDVFAHAWILYIRLISRTLKP